MPMERVKDSQITNRVARLQKEGCDIGLDGSFNQFRVTTKNGARDLSPRVPNRQILDWLDAFEEGWNQRDAGIKRTMVAYGIQGGNSGA